MKSTRFFLLSLVLAWTAGSEPSDRHTVTVLVDNIARHLSFSSSDNLVELATAFARKHDMRATETCPPEALEALGLGDCASAQLVNAMQAMLPPLPCSCQMHIMEPPPGQVWLLRSGAIAVAMSGAGCGAEFGGTRAFEGALSVQASFANEEAFVEFALDMRASDAGYLEINLPEATTAFGPLHLALSGQPGEHHPCTGHTFEANVTVDLRPFTMTDPRDVLSVEDLERRLQPSPSGSSLPRSSGDSSSERTTFAYASLLYSDGYLPGLLVLAASLREVATKYPLLTLVPLTDRSAFDAHQSGGGSSTATGLAVSRGTTAAMAQNGIEVVPVDWLNLSAGFALPALGAGIWLKLHLWKMTTYDRIVYLDADTFVLRNLDELFAMSSDAPTTFPSGAIRSERFGATNDYFAGAFFTLVPDVAIFEDMLKALTQSSHAGNNFVYGEQDFLNDYWRGNQRVVLDFRYHCLAEDLGTLGRDPTMLDPTLAEDAATQPALGIDDALSSSSNQGVRSAEDTCKVVEYASCDVFGETGVRWKPWMDPRLIQGKLVCRFPPTEAFWRTHARWLALQRRVIAS